MQYGSHGSYVARVDADAIREAVVLIRDSSGGAPMTCEGSMPNCRLIPPLLSDIEDSIADTLQRVLMIRLEDTR
jgi:hypothetical protein